MLKQLGPVHVQRSSALLCRHLCLLSNAAHGQVFSLVVGISDPVPHVAQME